MTEGVMTVDVATSVAAGSRFRWRRCAPRWPSGRARPAEDVHGAGAALESVEGCLYPATDAANPDEFEEMLTQMINKFIEQDRGTGFAAHADALKITPYQALIIASIAQSEAKFPEDMGKVARVILNRIAAHQPLQIDATSAYAAKLQGLDPAKVVYATIDSPYNTYLHAGLPPTPIRIPARTR